MENKEQQRKSNVNKAVHISTSKTKKQTNIEEWLQKFKTIRKCTMIRED